MAEALLLLAVVAVPLLAGAAAVALGRPWWWGAALAVVVFLLAAILPEPEPGEPRVAGEDVLFLLVVAFVVVGLAWLGALLARRSRLGRR